MHGQVYILWAVTVYIMAYTFLSKPLQPLSSKMQIIIFCSLSGFYSAPCPHYGSSAAVVGFYRFLLSIVCSILGRFFNQTTKHIFFWIIFASGNQCQQSLQRIFSPKLTEILATLLLRKPLDYAESTMNQIDSI